MKTRFISFILAVLTLLSVTAFINANAEDKTNTKQNWRYIVPPNKYDYCEPLSNGLIKIGMPVNPDSPSYDANYNNYNYGLLDRYGNLVADIIYNGISSPNNDGYMSANVFNPGGKDWIFMSDISDVFLLDKSGKVVSPADTKKITLNYPNFCYVETADKIFVYADGKTRSVSRKLIDAEETEFYGDVSKTSWYDFRAVNDDFFVMAATGGAMYIQSHIITHAVVFNWDGTVRCKTENFDSYDFTLLYDGILYKNKGITKFVDFDGKTKDLYINIDGKKISRLSLMPVYDGKTYRGIDGLYYYPTDGKGYSYTYNMNDPASYMIDGRKFSIINLKNPEAFKGFTFDGINLEDGVQGDASSQTIKLRNGGKLGLYSFDGEQILPFEYDVIGDVSTEGIIRLQEDKRFNRFSLANVKGEILLYTNAFDELMDFSEGLIGYQDRNGIYGFLDVKFDVVNPVIVLEKGWHIIDGFKDGIAAIGNENDSEIRFIDRRGKLLISEPDSKWVNYYRAAPNMIAVFTKDDNNTVGKGGVIEYMYNSMPLGDVLYTDIVAYINGNAIPTSVINGKTLVVAEDLANYGFNVVWNSGDRTLKIEQNKNKKVTPLKVEKDTTHKPGTYKEKYVYTDIKTYLSGEEVESYAINGRTLIDFELLKKYGKLTWDGNAREIRLVIS